MRQRVYLADFSPQAKAVRQATKRPVRLIGQPIGDMGKPIVDGDGDGKCRERGNKYVPCPPGVRAGTRLRNGVPIKPKRFDLRAGGGIDHKSLIHPDHRVTMDDKLKELGLDEETLRNETRAALSRANRGLRSRAKKWYPLLNRQTKKFIDDFNKKNNTKLTMENAAGVIAALSPMREFGKNLLDAKKLLTAIGQDKEFKISAAAMESLRKDRAALQAIIERSGGVLRPSSFKNDEVDLLAAVHPAISKLAGASGFLDVIKATKIARGEKADDVLSGPKVRSFYSNIIDPDGERATIDTWMFRIMVPKDAKINHQGIPRTTKQLERDGLALQKVFASSPQSKKHGIPKNVGLYPVFAQVIRDIAEENDLSPAALQAILWEVARTEAGNDPTQWDDLLKELQA